MPKTKNRPKGLKYIIKVQNRRWFKKGHNTWNKGRKGLQGANSGSFQKGEHRSFKTEFKKGNIRPEEWKEKTRFKLIGRKRPEISGEKNPNWQGGISKKPYPFNFNKELKELIKKRDNYICQICNKNPIRLVVHHIDYNKKNCNPDNLITLCYTCHCRTNYKRKYWIKYFNAKKC